MKLSEAGLNLIKRYEGFSPIKYICIAGYPTIGYGHVIKKGENYDNGITNEAAIELLKKDVRAAESAVRRLIPSLRVQCQFDALVSFTFNLGSGALQRSTLRQRLLRGDDLGAAEEFKKWIFASGKKSKGLLRRRLEERLVFLGLQEPEVDDNGEQF